MRFQDVRKSVVKGTIMDTGLAKINGTVDQVKLREVATVQRISPWENGDRLGQKLRKGVQADLILYPTYNRAKRRANGQVKPRKRIRGSLPPHPVAVINQAHRMQRNCSHAETYREDDVMYCSACHLEVFAA